MIGLTKLLPWKALKKHHAAVSKLHIKDIIKKRSVEFDGIYFDYSRHRVTDETLDLFRGLLEEVRLKTHIDAMFSGEKINTTEDRPALHSALRNRSSRPIMVDGKNVMEDINVVLARMRAFAGSVREGKIKNIVSIGIGGSALGPAMAYEALKGYSDRKLTVRFIGNIDPADFYENTRDLDPAETLFTIASKTFTTDETLTNAKRAKDWMTGELGETSVSERLVALSANEKEAVKFGIKPELIFPLWDWVGGRYSLMGAIGLPVMIAIGWENFKAILEGAHSVDNHFYQAKFSENIPMIMAVLDVWYNNFFGAETHAILPYSAYLHRLPAYLQQADMESSGKSVDKDGSVVNYSTGPIIWGEPGTNGQHSFYQLLHQGTRLVPVDFIGFREPSVGDGAQWARSHHQKLLANMIAQSRALAFGRENAKEPHRNFPGNRPSTTILLPKLTPYTLGQLIALYEHKIFAQGIIWNIDSFDQWGVELGKDLAKELLPAVKEGDLVALLGTSR